MTSFRRTPRDGERSVQVCCSAGHRESVLAVFHEELNGGGIRVNIRLLRDEIYHDDGKVRAKPQRITNTYNPDVVDVKGRQTVWEVQLDETGRPVSEDARRDGDDDGWYWHYTMRCPWDRCPSNVSAKSENLMPVLAELLDNGVACVEASDLNRKLAESTTRRGANRVN